MSTKKVSFKPPDGAVPEGTAVGDTFDLVCTFKLEGAGTVCLTKLGEHEMPGYDERPERPTHRTGEAQAMTASAPAGAPNYG